MKKHILYFCLMIFIAIGCQKTGETAEISTDDGKKWLVNPEMARHFEAMEADVSSFKSDDNIITLQSRLKDDIAQLTSKCTMEGQSHDELHKWLVPFIETVNVMHDQDPADVIDNLTNQFENYHTYFEPAP